jgi:malonyl CoA-acyl carrier protein transacylase
MEQKKPIEQLYQEKFGINEKVREERLQELLSSLDQAVETQDLEIATDLAEVTEGKVLINGRVKSLERLKEKN